MLNMFSITLSIVLTITSIAFCSINRQLDLLAGGNDPKSAFIKAVCLADGIVFGMSISLICLNLIQWKFRRKLYLLNELEDFGAIFAMYSMIVGTGLCIIDLQLLGTTQILIYLFITAVNAPAVVRYWRNAP